MLTPVGVANPAASHQTGSTPHQVQSQATARTPAGQGRQCDLVPPRLISEAMPSPRGARGLMAAWAPRSDPIARRHSWITAGQLSGEVFVEGGCVELMDAELVHPE